MTDNQEWRATEEGFWSRVWFYLRHDRWPQRYIGQDDGDERLWIIAGVFFLCIFALVGVLVIFGRP